MTHRSASIFFLLCGALLPSSLFAAENRDLRSNPLVNAPGEIRIASSLTLNPQILNSQAAELQNTAPQTAVPAPGPPPTTGAQAAAPQASSPPAAGPQTSDLSAPLSSSNGDPQDATAAVAPTPLEEIAEEENAPEDFFDLQTLDIPETLPPLDLQPEGPLTPEVTYDVPIVLNELVKDYIVFFQTRLRDRFQEWLSRSGRYIPMMQEILKKYELPEDLVFLALIESGFNPKAFSRARAAGPWQFIKGTGKKYGLRIDGWVDERRDPVKSTVAAAKYLKDLYGMFGSWPLSLASYNAGEGRIMRAMARTKAEDFWELKSSRHLRRETKNYVPKFMAATIIAKSPRKYGFSVEPTDPLLFEEAEISKATSLKTIAKAAGVSFEEVKALNPEIKRGITPPNTPRYRVKLPPGTKENFLKNFSSSGGSEAPIGNTEKHRIAKGETLSSIARKYGVSVPRLQEANQLGSESLIHAGQTLLIPLEN